MWMRAVYKGLAGLALATLASLGVGEIAGQSATDPNQVYDPALFADLDYRMVGPSRGGRVTAVAGHAGEEGTFYMGATGGGLWKTTDYGQSWANVSDGYFSTGSIGSIRVAPSNPRVIYVGTGSDGIRSNVIAGRGVYRSDDAGETWKDIGLHETGQIGAVLIHPRDPDLVYVAALGHAFGRNPDRGVYRSSDGGANWEQVLFTSDSVGAIDLEMHPTDPNTIYAAMWRGERKPWTIISGMEASGRENGIWRSRDGGDTWTLMDEGLPTGLIGKIDLAVSPDDPARVYALVETKEPEEGLYRSDDAGSTWRMVTNQKRIMDRPFYYTNVDADPTDADVVYVNATQFWKSTDGGATFERRSTPHGDNHDMWINPIDPLVMIQSNDGGANVTRDGGLTWSTQHNQPTAELYQVDVDDRFPYWLYAGQQDNSTIMVPSRVPEVSGLSGPESYWMAIGGCETGPVVPKPGDPDIVYANCKGRFGRYNHRTGQEKQYYVGAVNLYGVNPGELPYRFQRVVPIEVSPHDPGTVYHGSQFVHRTRDEGVTWEQISPDLTAFRPERQVISGTPITRDITGEEHYSVLYVIEESPVEPGVIWTGANDGPVHVTRDDGETWTEVTPPDMPAEGRIQNIDPSPHQGGRAYVAGYRHLLDDFRPYIYRTDDYGESWTLLTDGTNGIPDDYPTRVVREDPDRPGLLYAGTEFGMFISFDDGVHWQSFQLDLPITPITDLRVHNQDLVVSTMGRSFWVLDDVTPLHEIDETLASAEVHLFQPRDAYRVRGGGRGRGGPASGRPQYPQLGASIDYYLGDDVGGEVTLEILDHEGRTVRGFTSTAGGYPYEEFQDMGAPQRGGTEEPRVATAAGMHRFVWDLQYPGGLADRGPLAVPGRFEVRLTVDGRSQTRSFDILMDPRVAADNVTLADLQEQFALNIRIRDAIIRGRLAVQDLESAKEATEAGVESGRDAAERAMAALEELAEVEQALVTKTEGSYQTPMLVDQLSYLYSMTSGADQRPGRDAYERLQVLEQELERHIETLQRIMRAMIAEDLQ